jgi:magnesium-transporting ATPase (P-type)
MYLDLLLLFFIILFCIVGYIQGFVKQILSILCWVSIFFFATPFAHWLKESSGWEWFEKAPLLVNWGMAALTIGIIFMITGAIIHYARKNPQLAPTDRWIGMGLGMVKGILAAFVIALIFQVIPEKIRARFGEIHADSQSSWFVKGSASLLDSKALSITEHLGQIREELKKGEFFRSANQKHDPWQVDVSAERE